MDVERVSIKVRLGDRIRASNIGIEYQGHHLSD